MGYLINLLSIALVVSGLAFFIGGAVGLVRFPDFYTRMHAAGKGDTLSTILILAGVAIFVLHHVDHHPQPDEVKEHAMTFTSYIQGHVLVALKIMGIALFILLTSPTSTHALMQAGFDDGIKPFEKDKKIKEEDPAKS